MAKKIKPFAANISDVESIIQNMEQGNLALEEMLTQYAKGVELLAACRSQLVEAEAKVEAIKESGEENND